ncbi:MAG: cation:proton antiporter [Bacteroidales bacterium]|nr:cation:proton antiporter [Bacteroidales bacterium]
MHQQDFFQNAIIYLLAAVISVPVAKRLGFGSVLGYLLAGMIIGPFVLGLIGSEGEDVMNFAEFGVVMMLFLIGLELKPNLLWEMRKSIFGLGGLQLVISAVLIGTIAVVLGQTVGAGVAIGLTLGLSSTAIVLQTLNEKGLMKQASGQASFSVLLFQDISVVPILALIPLLASSAFSAGTASHEDIRYIGELEITGWVQVAMMLVVISGIVVVGLYLVKYVFRIIARTGLREIFTATALLLVIATAMLMDLVGLSPALGAFLSGIVLANNEYRHELEADVEPFKGLLLGLFFISVGASINFGLLISSPGLIVILLFSLIAVKFMVLFILGRFFGLRGGQNTLFAFALAQGGEFAFVLVAFSLNNGVIDAGVSSILLLVVALSMAVTPLLLLLNDKLILPLAFRSENIREHDVIDQNGHPVIIAGFGRFGVGMGRFLIANGIKATILDDNPDNIEVLRKFGFKVYYGDATRADLLASAGAGEAKVLVVAVDDKHQSLKIVDLAKRNYPHLKILVRSTDLDHTYELLDRKVDGIKRDTFESSLRLGTEVLTHLGYNSYRAHRLAGTFRQHNRKVIHELYRHHGEDEKKYLSEAKKFASELEELLQAENEDSSHEQDCSWDVSSRREEIQQINRSSPKGSN